MAAAPRDAVPKATPGIGKQVRVKPLQRPASDFDQPFTQRESFIDHAETGVELLHEQLKSGRYLPASRHLLNFRHYVY